MGKLYDRLQKQLKIEEYKQDAEDCLKIYEKLKEMNNGSVWNLQWQQLVDTHFKGFPSDDRRYKPSKMGYVFLKGIEEKQERKAGVRYIPVQMAIMSHLSDAQEILHIINCEEHYNTIKTKIKFVKQLMLTYTDTLVEVSENELNELWKKIIQ